MYVNYLLLITHLFSSLISSSVYLEKDDMKITLLVLYKYSPHVNTDCHNLGRTTFLQFKNHRMLYAPGENRCKLHEALFLLLPTPVSAPIQVGPMVN